MKNPTGLQLRKGSVDTRLYKGLRHELILKGAKHTPFLSDCFYHTKKQERTLQQPPNPKSVNLPDFSENNIVIEDATTLITISETFSQPESINSQLEPE
jgi:hypothetical protein